MQANGEENCVCVIDIDEDENAVVMVTVILNRFVVFTISFQYA